MYKNKVIKSLSMVNYLLSKKCELFKVDVDRDDREKLIFLFVENDYLINCIKNYKN